MVQYRTRIKDWKGILESELERNVTWEEIEASTGVAYSTLQKHQGHIFSRPDFAIATKICQFFNKTSRKKLRRVTPIEYFEEIEDSSEEMELVA
jgi:hypothetical protein